MRVFLCVTLSLQLSGSSGRLVLHLLGNVFYWLSISPPLSIFRSQPETQRTDSQHGVGIVQKASGDVEASCAETVYWDSGSARSGAVERRC